MAISKINQEEIIKNLGFKQLNQMQISTINASKEKDNLLLLAPTGSGKTVAYLLSVLEKLTDKPGIQILILAPTRELVIQIESVLKQMKLGLKVNTSYGGHKFSIERNNFTDPPTILVGTPGRLRDHIQRETFDVNGISQVIFDEFDKSLEFGFSAQMEYIVEQIPNIKGRILVSATKTIEAPDYLNFNDSFTINFAKESIGKLDLRQILVSKDEKPEGLMQIITNINTEENAIVFVNHRDACDRISEHFDDYGVAYSIFHGGLDQERRELELTKFRNGSTQILIATDIASRGIDIPELDYVIHYQMPPLENLFIHRNGRTARMKASGTSILIRTNLDKLPTYLKEEPKTLELKDAKEIKKPNWITLYVGKGKKDKVNKVDLVGFFLQFDFMNKTDLGLIEVKDFTSYIAINRDKSKRLLNASKGQKIKNKLIKLSVAR